MPVDNKPIAAGLMLDLGKPYSLRALRLRTPTDGFRIEIYGAESAKETPEDLLDKRWEHLTDIRKAEDNKLVSLHKKSENKSSCCCCTSRRRPNHRPARRHRERRDRRHAVDSRPCL